MRHNREIQSRGRERAREREKKQTREKRKKEREKKNTPTAHSSPIEFVPTPNAAVCSPVSLRPLLAGK
jgi:hypothetical protein